MVGNIRNPEGSLEVCHTLENPEVPTSEVDTSVGVTMQTAAEVQTSNSVPKVEERPVLRMTDVPMQYSSIADKWFKVGTYAWNTTQTAGTSLVILNLPTEAIQDQQLNQGFENFAYWRGKVQLRAVVNSTQWHTGLLKLCWAPCTTKNVYTNYRPQTNLTMLSNLKGGYIYANAPIVQEMICDFINPVNYISTQAPNDGTLDSSLGTFGLHVFEPLQAGASTSSSVDVTLFVKLPETEFHLPLGLALAKSAPMRRLAEGERPQSALLSKVRSFANRVESGLGKASKIVRISKDALDLLTALDHEVVPYSPDPYVQKHVGYLNCVDLPVKLDKLALVSQELAPTSTEHFSTKEDECDISYLLREPSFFRKISWGIGDAAGTQLYSGLTVPTMKYTNEYTSADTQGLKLTTLDWIALGMRFWRGPIDIHIKLVTTSFVTGTLRFSTLYGTFADTVTDEQANSQYWTILDLKDGQREYDIRLEFPSNTTLKEVMPIHKAAVSGINREKYTPGMFYIHVVNALAVANGSPNTVAILLYVSGADVEFYGVQPMGQQISGAPVNPTSVEVDESEDFDSPPPLAQGEVPQMKVSLGTGGSTLSSDVPLVRIVSLRDLVRRQYLYIGYPSSSAVGYTYRASDMFTQTTPMSYWCGGFAGRRGGLRWKIVYNQGNAMVCYWDPRAGASLTAGNWTAPSLNAFHQIRNGADTAFEVETSYTSQYNFLTSQFAIANANLELSNEGVLKTAFCQNAATGTQRFLVFGGADDFRMGIFLGPPIIDEAA